MRIDNSYPLRHIDPFDEIRWRVKTYTYNTFTPSDQIMLYDDLSDKIVSVSYDCDSSSNVKQSATITFYAELNNQYWYMTKEHAIRMASNSIYSDSSMGTSTPISIVPVIYKIEEDFYYYARRDKPTITRNYGFFIPDNNSIVYDSVTGQVTLQLKGLSAGLTSEYGGRIQMPMRSMDTFIYRDGKFAFFKQYQINDVERKNETPEIQRYNKESYYHFENVNSGKGVTLTEVAMQETEKLKKTTSYKTKEKATYRNSMAKDVADGHRTTQDANPIIYTPEQKPINTPITLSLPCCEESNLTVQNDPTPIYYGDLDFIWDIVSCNPSTGILNSWRVPIKSMRTPWACDVNFFPHDVDFDVDVSFSDIIEKTLDILLKGYMYWVDEDRVLRIDYKPRQRGGSNVGLYEEFANWGELVIDEEISYNDNEFYNATEVYGKDSQYYGFVSCSTSPSINANINFETGKSYNMPDWGAEKKQTITDEDIESDGEAFERALYETLKASKGHEVVTVKVRDDGSFLYKPSMAVGYPIEYRTMQGDTNAMILEKASLSDNVWTLTMTYFHNIPSALDKGEYTNPPTINSVQMISANIARISLSGTGGKTYKIYSNYGSTGTANFSNCIGETCSNTFDFYVEQSGSYSFVAATYDFNADEGGLSNIYTANLQVKMPERPKDPYLKDDDPYSPIYWEHDPYIIVPINQILTDENGNRLTI